MAILSKIGFREGDIIYSNIPEWINTIHKPDTVNVTVTCNKLVRNKRKSKILTAWVITDNERKDFILETSRSQLENRQNFFIAPGSVVEFEGRIYECFSIEVIPTSSQLFLVLRTIPAAL